MGAHSRPCVGGCTQFHGPDEPAGLGAIEILRILTDALAQANKRLPPEKKA